MGIVKQNIEIKYSVIKDCRTGIEVLFIDLLAAINNRDEYRDYLLKYPEDGRCVFTEHSIAPFYIINSTNTLISLSDNLAKILTVLSKSKLPPLDKQQKTDVARNITNIIVLKENILAEDVELRVGILNSIKKIVVDVMVTFQKYMFKRVINTHVARRMDTQDGKYKVSVRKNKLAFQYSEEQHIFDNLFTKFGNISAFCALTEITISVLDLLNSIFSVPFLVIVGVAIFFAGWDDTSLANRSKLQRLACSFRRAFRGESFFSRPHLQFDPHQVWRSCIGIALLLVAMVLQVLVIFSRPIKIYKSIEDIVTSNNWGNFFYIFNYLTRLGLGLTLIGKGVDSGQNKEIGLWFKIKPSYEIQFQEIGVKKQFSWRNIFHHAEHVVVEIDGPTRGFNYIPSQGLTRTRSESALEKVSVERDEIKIASSNFGFIKM